VTAHGIGRSRVLCGRGIEGLGKNESARVNFLVVDPVQRTDTPPSTKSVSPPKKTK
jgi:hypothetical protein